MKKEATVMWKVHQTASTSDLSQSQLSYFLFPIVTQPLTRGCWCLIFRPKRTFVQTQACLVKFFLTAFVFFFFHPTKVS